ncbi:PKD domain-containing protein [Marinoscillum luteum]|uniref:PKD domain-containing protein n=1 Tax=Marinoscillum luteum TaxID=861051 RepID=A0ABW7NBX8_9BACT
MKIIRSILYSGVLVMLLTSCFPEDEDLSLGEIVEAAFTITDISTSEMRNTYLLESSSEGAFIYKWDLGNGTVITGSKTDTAFFESKGVYTVSLTVVSAGGQSTTEQQVTVEADASTGVNVLLGSEMDDESAWTFTSTGSTMTSYTFSDGKLILSNGTEVAQTNIAVWQEVELTGGTDYQFSASASGSGMTNSWVEVLLLDEEPQEGVDPSATPIAGLNTWTGCGGDAFDGKLPAISCIGDGKVSVAEDGTYYLLIKVGSWDGNLGTTGLILDDVVLVGLDTTPLVEGDNILVGSNMEDENVWTVTNVGLTLTTVEFVDGVMKFTNGSEPAQTNVGVWQAVDVEAGQKYRLKATVVDPGATGSWIEFYVHTTEPSDGTDYTQGRIEIGGDTSFEEAGTVYFLIKVGSWDGNLGSGVTIDDTQLVELN